MHWNTLTDPDQTSHDGQLGEVHIVVNFMWKYRLDIIVNGHKEAAAQATAGVTK